METLKPSEIYFTQSSISSTFGRSTQHNRKKIGETLDDLVEGHCSVQRIPRISVLKEEGKWWTADNRRLWIFRHLEKLGKCTTIPVNITCNIDSRKRTTYNDGTDVRIYKGNDPGGDWHKKVSSIAIPIRPQRTETSENTKASASSINIHETKPSTVNADNHNYMSCVKTIPIDILENKSVVNTIPAIVVDAVYINGANDRKRKDPNSLTSRETQYINVVDTVNINGANDRKRKDPNTLTSRDMQYISKNNSCKQNSFGIGRSVRKNCVGKPFRWKRRPSFLNNYFLVNWFGYKEIAYSTNKTYESERRYHERQRKKTKRLIEEM